MRVFDEGVLDEVLASQERAMRAALRRESEDYVLNVNTDDYVEHLVQTYSLDIPVMVREDVTAESSEKLIPAEHFPRFYEVYAGKSYPKQVLTYYVPFTGEIGLLRYAPNPRLMWAMEMGEAGNALTFDIVIWSDDAEQIRREANRVLDNLEEQARNSAVQAQAFNDGLRVKAEEALQSRRAELSKHGKLVAELGVPIRKRDDLPKTFAVPPPAKRKRISVKPEIVPAGAPLDPTLDLETYKEILQTIWDLGITTERLPSTYAGKDEETLRDHILLYLTPRFEGSTTGETFNKSGKTDILLRYESSNVFIAECKFWSGRKAFLEAIDQLLTYLTWRDSKAALVVFVRNKDFSAVLQTIRDTMPDHSAFLRHVRDVEESWFEFRLSLPGDPGREIWLSVLAFHLPEER